MMATHDLCKDWTAEDHAFLRAEVPRRGLDTPFRQGTVRDLAREILAYSDSGLKRRGLTDSMGQDESHFLRELKKRADGGPTPAEGLLHAYENEWGGNIDALFEDIAY